MPIPERYWEITVAIAAPSTPNFNTITKNKSNAILSIAETAKNISVGGSFVPLELLGDSVLQVARYTPSYWYNHAVEAISGLVRFDSQALGPVFISMAIQTGFAAAVFSVALVISKFRRQRTEGFASVKTEMA